MTSATRQPETPAAIHRPRLIATDLDGTLLRDDGQVSPRTVAALAAAEDAGIEVFFVTGRPARWMDAVSDHVHGHGLAICGNGAAVVDLHGGPGTHRFVKVRELARENALDAVRLLREAAPGTVYAVEQTYGFYQEPEYPKMHMEIPDDLAPAEELLAADGPCAGEPVLKILAYHRTLDPDEFLTLAREAIGERAEVTRSSPSALLEIAGPGISKASTLALCCAERGIAPEEVVAFGDMPNDVEMLTWAGRSYAMGNAHPDVIAAASGQTAANNEDGVAVVIERLVAERA
ncbi:Cof-type HAD-IIB family hydrolase [Streptomyces sp. LBUM 1476]|uniref:Cof-type HAD-IIB family hydrolase n=1 Tax=Streptomyces acidiscabies TaxID=42234 RepID=A0AAP6BCU8_9ACTN|nr:Cof-type HAD-IIB family hydrolase [Streptomyces acidiscabies]MBP5938427.1 Cof-type HAD-IIB family hydrolase [Streptomyces sp. LBUM 1476]MBZ3909527.1 Cof-type HAD-IIB family hydrolase [Streptomyces acidiscabies]MDX2962305.1 Cof-type HAD-IIB family hydrolase [Streptomyces acidiscabies]MDX3019757.1 Cof-type HAD-IIB family hydrolase [Streptomyces acidiscabies]MDX3792324.1 Cof-type HAD-IIB family hydrolase [Streptomyces acidiscabies]